MNSTTNVLRAKIGILSVFSVTALFQSASGASLLIDAYGGQDPTLASNWSDAGVTEDVSDGAGGTFHSAFGTFNISGGLGFSHTGVTGDFNAPTFSGNTMLNNYWYVDGGGVNTVTIDGFQTGGVANTLTSSLGTMADNTFTIGINQTYRLYLFGAGNANDQNTTFTFDGISKTTNSSIVGTSANDGHFVTYDFTTGADLTGFNLVFNYQNASSTAAFNGLALVAIPESSAALLGSLGLLALFRRRRCN